MADIDPEAQAILHRLAEHKDLASDHAMNDAGWVASYRDQVLRMRALGEPAEPADCAQFSFEGPDGPLDLRGYRGRAGTLPGVVYFHGGGFVAGSLETHDPALRTLAADTGAAVIAVEYRRAPEHPFPSAPEDCYAAAVHVASHAATFGIDPARLVVAGDSAGGLLATVVAAMARDRNGPALAGQACFYPNADLRHGRDHASLAEHDGRVVDLGELARSLRLYLNGADPRHPYASPLLATDLSDLPPAFIATCEMDPLRDEAERYITRLREAGVPVEHLRLPGMIHGVLQMAGMTQATRRLTGAFSRWLGAI